MPDAFSKTVPIWCTVINRAILLRYPNINHTNTNVSLYTPPSVVSRQEHAQIEARLDAWATDLAESSYPLPLLKHPLRPIWITPATSQLPSFSQTSPFIPVICLSASRQVQDGIERRDSSFTYVQGSGDDHELWAMGLTPSMLWSNKGVFLDQTRDTIEDFVRDLVLTPSNLTPPSRPPTKIDRVGARILISTLSDSSSPADCSLIRLVGKDTAQINDSEDSEAQPVLASQKDVLIQEGKKGQMNYLRHVLPTCMTFIRDRLEGGHCVCIACPDGQDQSVGVAVCALALWFDNEGRFTTHSDRKIDKKTIRTRLEWIIASHLTANPSRTTLKRVNEYILSRPVFNVQRYESENIKANVPLNDP